MSYIYTLIEGIDGAVHRRDSSDMPDEAETKRRSPALPPALEQAIEKAKEFENDASKTELEKRYAIAKLARDVAENKDGKYGKFGLTRLAKAIGRDKSTVSRAAGIATHWNITDLKKLAKRVGPNGLTLTWSHFELVAEKPQARQREALLERIFKEGLTVRKLKGVMRTPKAKATGPDADAAALKEISTKANKLASLIRERERLLAAGNENVPQVVMVLEELRANMAFLQDAVQDAVAWIPAAPAATKPVEEKKQEEPPVDEEHHGEAHGSGAEEPPTNEVKPAPEPVVEPVPEKPPVVETNIADPENKAIHVLGHPNDEAGHKKRKHR